MNAKIYVRAAAVATALTTVVTVTGANRSGANPFGLIS